MKSALTIAQKFLDLASEQGRTLTPMQLLKLVYIAHGWMLGLYDRPLIKENVEAWPYGPVIPELYHAVKKYRDKPVQKIQRRTQESLDAQEAALIIDVYSKYGSFSGIELSSMTHAKGTPWHKTFDQSGVISNDLIQSHYKRLSQGGL